MKRRFNNYVGSTVALFLVFLVAFDAFAANQKQVPPHRTFITLQRYFIENIGISDDELAEVRLEVTFPSGNTIELPQKNAYWMVGNKKSQAINKTFEVPWVYVQNDDFTFTVQIVRKGASYLPCQFQVTQLSQFGRQYVCRTDSQYQALKHHSAEDQDKEGVEVRVFTDLEPSGIPLS